MYTRCGSLRLIEDSESDAGMPFTAGSSRDCRIAEGSQARNLFVFVTPSQPREEAQVRDHQAR